MIADCQPKFSTLNNVGVLCWIGNQPKPGLDMKLVTKKRESSVKHNRGWGFKGNGFIYFLKYYCCFHAL